jgi:hypothetical protein
MEAKVRPHNCVVAGLIVIQCGRTSFADKPKVEVPWFNRNNGAAYQDEKYGKGMRLMNRAIRVERGKIKKDDGWRCTVCGCIAN